MASEREDRPSLEPRISAAEKKLELLERRLAELEQRGSTDLEPLPFSARAARTASSSEIAAPAPVDASLPPLPPRRRARRPAPADPGQWVNRLGIALVILGAAFGFKYSVDRGWIGPAVRVLCGLLLGASMVGASGRLRDRRPGLSRVLAGGGVACGYLSVFAAFQLYGLISQGAAVVAMTAVTLLAFAVAVRSEDAMAATIGTIGGLATPFLLHSGAGNVVGLVAYTGLVATAASAVFVAKGWRVVLWTTVLGAWPVMFAATDHLARGAGFDAVAVQLGIVYLALATWWVCVIRETLTVEDPARWKPTTAGLGVDLGPARFAGQGGWRELPHQLTLATPVAVLFASTWTWKIGDTASGWIALSLTAGWGLASLHLRRLSPKDVDAALAHLATTHAMAAAVMLAFAMSYLLGEDARRVGLAAEALAVLVVVGGMERTGGMDRTSMSRRLGPPQPATLAHLLFAVVGVWTFFGLTDAIDADRAGPASALAADLAVVAALAVASWRRPRPQSGIVYATAAQAGLLLWFLRALGPLDNGAVLVTAAWFANAVIVLVAGLRTDSATLRKAGAALMALTMAKLFIVDLATADALWRVGIFLGFGAVLLGLGYAFPSLWKQSEEPPSQP